MFQSASSGDVDGLKSLCAVNPDLVHCEYGYRTPLHFAVRENQLDAARWLIDNGAKAAYASGQYWHDSPMDLAKDRHYEEMSRLIAEVLWETFRICPAGDEIAHAIRERDTKLTAALIATHGVEVADKRGNQPLHWAVLTRQLSLIDWLLDLEADINAARPDGARPLHLTGGDYWYRASRDLDPVALKNHGMLTGYLLAQGAEYDIATATQVGDIERVREILDAEPALANAVPAYNNWYTGFPLKCAAQKGYSEIARLLLENGADPNQMERGLAPWGSALYYAVGAGHSDLVMLLLEHGANPNQEVESSGNCLSVAHDDLTRDLLRERGAHSGVFACCLDNHVDDLREQFRKCPHLANDPDQFAAAAHRGFHEIVALFLEHQPDLFQRMPARLGETSTIRDWMLGQGMLPGNCDWLGVHGMHHAVTTKDPAETRLWVSLNVNIDTIDGEHQSSPLGWAAKHGQLEVTRSLLRQGADPNASGESWSMPLAWARRRGHVEVAEALVAAGAVEDGRAGG